jgi:hypothetical protein
MSHQSLGCKTCPTCHSNLMCPTAQPGKARVQCSACHRRGVRTHFCLLCEQVWKASSMDQEASCGNLGCQASKITVLELMRVGGLPENRKSIGNIRNVPDNRSCPRKECRRKFGQYTRSQTEKDKLFGHRALTQSRLARRRDIDRLRLSARASGRGSGVAGAPQPKSTPGQSPCPGYRTHGHKNACKHVQCPLCTKTFCFSCLALKGEDGNYPASCGRVDTVCRGQNRKTAGADGRGRGIRRLADVSSYESERARPRAFFF